MCVRNAWREPAQRARAGRVPPHHSCLSPQMGLPLSGTRQRSPQNRCVERLPPERAVSANSTYTTLKAHLNAKEQQEGQRASSFACILLPYGQRVLRRDPRFLKHLPPAVHKCLFATCKPISPAGNYNILRLLGCFSEHNDNSTKYRFTCLRHRNCSIMSRQAMLRLSKLDFCLLSVPEELFRRQLRPRIRIEEF